ncbi:MAG: hypothetical protein KKE57_09965, partial [Proteobacteria bacterium]|nr:hypothetical protein [Pseudomonadota bacterium]
NFEYRSENFIILRFLVRPARSAFGLTGDSGATLILTKQVLSHFLAVARQAGIRYSIFWGTYTHPPNTPFVKCG